MENNRQELANAIEKAILIRDRRCETLEEKDALALLINFVDGCISINKENR